MIPNQPQPTPPSAGTSSTPAQRIAATLHGSAGDPRVAAILDVLREDLGFRIGAVAAPDLGPDRRAHEAGGLAAVVALVDRLSRLTAG